MNFLDKFESFLLEKGVKSDTGIPSTPMSESSVKSRLTLVRAILMELGYVKREHVEIDMKKSNKHGNSLGNPHLKYKYLVHSNSNPDIKQLNKLSIPELEKHFSDSFKNLNDFKEKRRKTSYVFAFWKFGEFLNYKGYWTNKKLEKLKYKVRPISAKDRDIDTLAPNKVDQFLEYLKDHTYKLYAMLFISRWIGGMRYGAVIRIKRNFKGYGGESGTFNYDMKSEKAKVYGKGEGGWNKPREEGCKIAPHVRKTLKEILNWRNNQKNDLDWLFVNRFGERYSSYSSFVNQSFKVHAINSGLFKDEEIQYFKFHSLGRHTFGTYFYGKIPDKDLQLEMGHEKIETTLKYAQIQHDENSYNNFVKVAEQNADQDQNTVTVEIDPDDDIDSAIQILRSMKNGAKSKFISTLPDDKKTMILSKMLGC